MQKGLPNELLPRDDAPTQGQVTCHSEDMSAGGQQDRQAWVRANFTTIFGTSAEDLQSQGVDPREYAAQHRDQIRQFAQLQRSQGIAVPAGRDNVTPGPSDDPTAPVPPRNANGDGGGRRFGAGRRGGSAWIGVVFVLFALRFLLISSTRGTHAALFWVLGIGGVMLVARVVLYSWLRNRRRRNLQTSVRQQLCHRCRRPRVCRRPTGPSRTAPH